MFQCRRRETKGTWSHLLFDEFHGLVLVHLCVCLPDAPVVLVRLGVVAELAGVIIYEIERRRRRMKDCRRHLH